MGTISSFNLGPAQEYLLQGTKRTLISVLPTAHLVALGQQVLSNLPVQEVAHRAGTTVLADALSGLAMIGTLRFGLRMKTSVIGG